MLTFSPMAALFPTLHSQTLACASLADSKRREKRSQYANAVSYFPSTRMEPWGCFLSAVSFNLCYFCPVYVDNTHLNRQAQYRTLTQSQQPAI